MRQTLHKYLPIPRFNQSPISAYDLYIAPLWYKVYRPDVLFLATSFFLPFLTESRQKFLKRYKINLFSWSPKESELKQQLFFHFNSRRIRTGHWD